MLSPRALKQGLLAIACMKSATRSGTARASSEECDSQTTRADPSEVAIFVIFLLLLIGSTLAGFPDVARPMSALDYIDAMLSSFAMFFLFTLWVGKRIESGFILHGALVGVVGILLFSTMWVSTTGGSLASQPPLYIVAHVLKVLGGITGGLVTERRRRRVLQQSESAGFEN